MALLNGDVPGSAIVLDAHLAPDRNPALTYVASLAPGSRRTMTEALAIIADMVAPGVTAETFSWHHVRFQHAAAIRARLAERYSPATSNKILAALRGVFRHAFTLGLIDAEHYERVRHVESIKGVRIARGRALPAGELRALFEACDGSKPGGTRNAALLAILYGGGLRRSEIVSLDLADFDATSGVLKVKGNKERVSYVTNGARNALDAWLALRGDAPGPLFVSVSKGGRLVARRLSDQSVLDIVRRLARHANVPRFSPHDSRRTFIGDMLDLGVDISTVQQLAGHAQVTTTARYDRRGEHVRRRAAEMLHVPFKSK
jgi:site-specific recombinase XerD